MKETELEIVHRWSARLLLIVFAIHVLTVHSFAGSLVYCFEENGEVNIETKAESSLFVNSETTVHAENCLKQHQEKIVFHQDQEQHKDVPLSLLCEDKDTLSQFDQQLTIYFLHKAISQRIKVLSPSRFFQKTVFLPPAIEYGITTSLQTVVLLN